MRNLLLAAFAVLFLTSPAVSQSAVDPAVSPAPVIAPAPAAAPVVTQTTTPTTVPAGSTVVVTAPTPVDTTVSVPIGAWANTALGYLGLMLGGVVVWGLRLLPAQVYALAMTMRADQLMTKALAFALNAAGASVQNKVWTVDTRNMVLKDIATFVIVHGADAVKSFMGTPADFAEKGFARITGIVDPTSGIQQTSPLPNAPKPDFAAIGAQAAAAANVETIKRT